MSSQSSAYRRDCLVVVFTLLTIWFVAGFGCSILFRETLDNAMPSVGHAPFGFWMSQQGSIITFILLLIVYRFWMNRVDAKHGFAAESS